MREKGVATITIGTGLETSKLAIQMAEEFPDVVLGATVGIHPNSMSRSDLDMGGVKKLASNDKVVAIGECGLDYYRLVGSAQLTVDSQKEIQKELFKKHIELALEVKKPLMIHARPSKNSMDAYEDAIEILESYAPGGAGSGPAGNFHFFVGSPNIARRIAENGWTMSFDGPITFTHEYDETIKSLPIESIMAETDAPFACPEPHRSGGAAPEPYRGRASVCEPWMVEEVYKKIAEIRGEDPEKVREALNQNAKRFFDLKI